MNGGATDLYSGGAIHARGRYFIDDHGRVLLLRGVNLSGNSKLPTRPNGFTHVSDGFFEHKDISFVGRPFPLNEAHIHLSRLRAWGLTLVRLVITWESIEHSGPGIYDDEYADYLRELIQLMPKYGIKCFIDAHQDTWSRFTGGSGAPGWTLEAAGLDMTQFKATGAAYVHNTNSSPDDPLPMVWPTNYTKMATLTMFTLFWAGNLLAPEVKYQGQSIQPFLQDHFLNAFAYLAERLKDLPAIIGYEVMNEPHPGLIGLRDLYAFDQRINLHLGDSPSAVESFALAAGYSLPVPHFTKSWPVPTIASSKRILNRERKNAWLDGQCIWRNHSIWEWDKAKNRPILLRPNYFNRHPTTGEPIYFYDDFYIPFVRRFADTIRATDKRAFIFVEPIPNEIWPKWNADNSDLIFAPHWYDLNAIFKKSFDGYVTHDVQALQRGDNVFNATFFGEKGARKNYLGQITNIVKGGYEHFGERPCIMGECGIPIDMNERNAFKTGDFSLHSSYLDAMINAMEQNMIAYTLWNYNPLNNDEYGDSWNFENFSIFNAGKTESDTLKVHAGPYIGGRALDAVIRPYAAKIAGIPASTAYDRRTFTFSFTFRNDTSMKLTSQTTEIFLPALHYKQAAENGTLDVHVSDGEWHLDMDKETMFYTHFNPKDGFEHTLHISIKGRQRPRTRTISSFIYLLAFFIIILAFILNGSKQSFV